MQDAPRKKVVNMDLGPWEIGLMLVIILIVFGASKPPQVDAGVVKVIRHNQVLGPPKVERRGFRAQACGNHH